MQTKEKKVAILQSNYIPWKGYFDMIASVDEFIIYDEMQYTRRDWRNRNKIKTQNGLKWLSIPVNSKNFQQNGLKISDAKINDKHFVKSHWDSIRFSYLNAPYFKEYENFFKDLYKDCENEEYLCKVNYKFIFAICELLNIKTKLSFDKDYGIIEGKTERLVDLVKKAGGTEYISGPAAKVYVNRTLFEQANIKLSWMDYSGYKEYPQLYPPFEHCVTILDLFFNCGKDAKKYMKGLKND